MSNLFTKVTSTTSALAIVATAMSSSLTAFAASEFATYAEALAEAGVINVQTSEAGYRLGDNITRAEMAKIAVILADDTAVECAGDVFTDVTDKQGDLCGYIESAAALEIVSTANTKFRPSDLVTRAEMVKMLLVARGVAPTDVSAGFDDVPASMGDLYGYINAAVEEGLVKSGKSFRPNATATRGEAFKVASGAYDLDTSEPVEPPVTTGTGTTTTGTGTTTTGTGTTTSTGTTTTVASGDLGVNLNPKSPASGSQIPATGIVRMAIADFSAGGSDISVNTVELKKAGLGSLPSGTKIWFEKAGTRLSGKASFTSENNAVVSFAPALVVAAGATQSLDFYVELSGATTGNDLQLFSAAINSSAKNVTGSFTTPSLRVTNYAVASSTFTAQTSGQTYNAGTDALELAKFTIANTDTNTDTRDLKLQSVLLYQSGSAALTNLSDIIVEKNGVKVSSSATVSGKMLTLSISDIIKDGGTAIYTVKAKINNVELTNDTYQFYLKNASDINLVEVDSAFRSSLTISVANAALYNVSGGDVKFERDTASALSQTVAPGTDGVVLMKGKITAKSAVTLENLNQSFTLTTSTGGSVSLNTIYLQIGSSTFTATPGNFTGQTLSFLGTATVSGTADVKIYAKLKDGASGTIKLSSMNIGSFERKEYASNQNTVGSAIGSIDGVTVTVGASTLNVTRTDGLGATNIASGSKGVKVYGARFTSTQGNPIALSNFTVVTTGTANAYTGGNTSLTLWVDGVAKSTKNVTTTNVSFDGFNSIVSTASSGTVNVEIKADFSDVTTSGTFGIASIGYDAVDNLTSVSLATKPTVVGAVFTIATAVGTLAANSGTMEITKSLFKAGTLNKRFTSFRIKATNDNIKLKEITLTGANLDALSNIVLTNDVGTVIGTASAVTSTGAKFENLDSNSASSLAMDATSIYYVVADIKTTTNVSGVVVNVVPTGSTVTGSNGSIQNMSGVVVAGASHDIAENTFKVSNNTPLSKSLETNALVFKVTVEGKDGVTLSGVTIDTNLGAYSNSSATGVISIYDSSNKLVWQKVVGTASGTISTVVPLTANNVVTSGDMSFTVKITGFTLNISTNERWTVSMKSLTINTGVNTLDAASYLNNADPFPIESVKN